MKKLLSLFLSAVMLMSLFSGLQISSAALDSEGACGDNVNYTFDSAAGKLIISGTGDMYDYTPNNKSPFNSNTEIKLIVICEGVTGIGNNAFSKCKGVKSVKIPSTVTKIGMAAFSNCSALEFAVIPSGTESIGLSAFYYCNSLKDISVPDSVKSIGNNAFTGCTNLKLICYSGTAEEWNALSKGSFNDPLNEADVEADCLSGYCSDTAYYHFYSSDARISICGTGAMDDYPVEHPEYYAYTDNIKEIYVNSGITRIGENAFCDLPNLTAVYIDSSVKEIGGAAFSSCSLLECIEIPEGTTNIEGYAFKLCTALKSVTIPESLKALGTKPFDGASDTFTVKSSCKQELVNSIIEGTGRIWEKKHQAPKSAAVENLVEATCTEQGSYDEVVRCSYCDEIISSEHFTLEPTGHSLFKNKTVNPTAVKAGYVEYKCSACPLISRTVSAPTGKVKSVKCKARTAATEKIIWSSLNGAQGYQIQISNAAGNKWEKVYNAKTATTFTFTKLAAGSNYKFRVRIYAKGIDGKYYYGAWTSIASPTLPKGTTITKFTPAKKAFTAQWKKGACTGYQLQYAANKKFSGAKTVTIKKVGTLKYTVSKLSSNKNYYVRVRTYKAISGANYYSTWSAIKAVKVK